MKRKPKVTVPKPRAEELNSLLLSRPAGPMKDKSKKSRQQERIQLQKLHG